MKSVTDATDELIGPSINSIELDIVNHIGEADTIVSLVTKCLTVCRFSPEDNFVLQIRYHTLLAHAYIEFKGPTFASQAEEHLKDARLLQFQGCAASSRPKSTPALRLRNGTYTTESLSDTLTLLLWHYTSARAALHGSKFKAAEKYALSAQMLLDELPCCDKSGYSTEYSQDSKEPFDLIDFSNLDSVLLDPRSGFYPKLQKIQINILKIMSSCYVEQGNYKAAKQNLMQAKKLCCPDRENDRKEAIVLNLGLAKVAKHLVENDPRDTSLQYLQAAYELANHVVADDDTESNRLLLMNCAHHLCTAYMEEGTEFSLDKAESLLNKVLEWSEQYDGQVDNNPFTTNAFCHKHTGAGTEFSTDLLHTFEFSTKLDEVTVSDNSPDYVRSVCLLRSTLIKILLCQKRTEDAIKLIKQNLFFQQMYFGLYSKQAVVTEKMLLSALLTQGDIKEAKKHAIMCLEMETFTFGSKSKQAKKTKEILDTLNSLQY